MHPQTHPTFRCQTQCREGHSTYEHGQQETLANSDVLRLDTSDLSNISINYFNDVKAEVIVYINKLL